MSTSIRASLRARKLHVVRDAEHALELCEKHGAKDFLFATSGRRGAASPWHALLAQVTKRLPSETVTGRSIVIELERGASDDIKRTVAALARTLITAGAAEVHVWGHSFTQTRAA